MTPKRRDEMKEERQPQLPGKRSYAKSTLKVYGTVGDLTHALSKKGKEDGVKKSNNLEKSGS
jgi:hypothetical protein